LRFIVIGYIITRYIKGDPMTEPLSEAAFQILLALSDRPRHGLGVAAEVESRTGGRVTLGASTLYTAFKRMRDDDWIEEVEAPEGEDDPRRRFYALTRKGQQVLKGEARRLETLVRDARGKAVLPKERPA
jgi:DNA-binding PadR family transcriptional regulator